MLFSQSFFTFVQFSFTLFALGHNGSALRRHLVVVLQHVLQVVVFLGHGLPLLAAAALALPDGDGRLLGALVPHGGDALLAQVVLDLVIIHTFNGDGAPQLGKLIVEFKVTGVVMIEDDLKCKMGLTQFNYLL